MSQDVDCIIVGHHEVNFPAAVRNWKSLDSVMGIYQWARTESVPLGNDRLTYADLLNHVVTKATGATSQLHIAATPHLGAHYLASFLRTRSVHAEVVNFVNYHESRLKDLLSCRPKLVAICTTYYVEATPIQEIIAVIRRYNADVKIVVGGPFMFNQYSDSAPARRQQIFKRLGADFYIYDGQGEYALWALSSELKKIRPRFESIANLAYKTPAGDFIENERKVEDNNLESNMVRWDLFSPEELGRMVSVRTARSCAFKCAFCRYPLLAGALVCAPVAAVEKELNTLHEMGVTHLAFIDDTFNIPQPRFKDLMRMMIRNKYNFEWESYFRCGNADEESMRLAAEAGCRWVYLGIESGDQQMLRTMNKAAKIERYRWGIERLNSYGVWTHGSFIIGHPGETEESAQASIEFVNESGLKSFHIQLYFHDNKVPIGQHDEKYGVTGGHYGWKHNGMDWKRACEIINDAYMNQVKGPISIPVLSFNPEFMTYLRSQGFSHERIVSFVKTASDMLVNGIRDDNFDSSKDEATLVNLFRAPAEDAAAPFAQIPSASAPVRVVEKPHESPVTVRC